MSRRLLAVTALMLLLAALLAGCSRASKTGEQTNTGLLTGYEMSNQDDFADMRKERPDYRPFE